MGRTSEEETQSLSLVASIITQKGSCSIKPDTSTDHLAHSVLRGGLAPYETV